MGVRQSFNGQPVSNITNAYFNYSPQKKLLKKITGWA